MVIMLSNICYLNKTCIIFSVNSASQLAMVMKKTNFLSILSTSSLPNNFYRKPLYWMGKLLPHILKQGKKNSFVLCVRLDLGCRPSVFLTCPQFVQFIIIGKSYLRLLWKQARWYVFVKFIQHKLLGW